MMLINNIYNENVTLGNQGVVKNLRTLWFDDEYYSYNVCIRKY